MANLSFASDVADDQPQRFYCSTSDTYFDSKEKLSEHHKSDFHRYNLKRKVAGLPPVTRDWFDARKDQLSNKAGTQVQKTWTDPLTKKRFNSENTYTSYVNSKKYQELVRNSGELAPKPVTSVRRLSEPAADQATQVTQQQQQQQQQSPHYTVTQLPYERGSKHTSSGLSQQEDEEAGWETASDSSEDTTLTAGGEQASVPARARSEEEAQTAVDDWQPWDPCCSLLDNHKSESPDANLEYMWRKFRFSIPDAEYLVDPAGLLNYLAMKMDKGRMPLYVRGDEPNPKQMASFHGVQRHMVDTGLCKMVYEDNEEEYEDFYDYSSADDAADPAMQLVDAGSHALDPAQSSYELAVSGGAQAGGRLLGHRDFARFYKQRHRTTDLRPSVAANTVLAKYRALGIATAEGGVDADVKRAQRQAKKGDRLRLNTELRANVNRDLPRNVAW